MNRALLVFGGCIALAACGVGAHGSSSTPSAPKSVSADGRATLQVVLPANYHRAASAKRQPKFVDPSSGNIISVSVSPQYGLPTAAPDVTITPGAGTMNVSVPMFSDTQNTVTVNEYDSTRAHLLASGITSYYAPSAGASTSITVLLNMIASGIVAVAPDTGGGNGYYSVLGSGVAPFATGTAAPFNAQFKCYTPYVSGTAAPQPIIFYGADALGGYVTGANGTNAGTPAISIDSVVANDGGTIVGPTTDGTGARTWVYTGPTGSPAPTITLTSPGTTQNVLQYSAQTGLAYGPTVHVTATDTSGNVSGSAQLQIDTFPPC